MATYVGNHFLAGVIASPRGGYITEENRFRRYKSNITTSAVLAGNTDSRITQILYEVGRAVGTKARALASPGEAAFRVEASYDTSTALAEDFSGLAKKYTNFSTSFKHSSLAGVVERLAKALAAATVFQDVSSSDIRGGSQLVINTLGTYDGPVTSLNNVVFIPRLVNSIMTGDVFAVLVNAVAGEGASIATDVLELDATTRQPIVATVGPGEVVMPIVEALRVLGANMLACDQGPLFALALTRGIHKVLTVVGHTDEGGIARDLLRCGHFAVPFGGIHYGLEPYAGIPALTSNGIAQACSYVDSLALATAALVAHSDPGEFYQGRWFPTFYLGASPSDDDARPGDHLEGTGAMAARIRGQVLSAQQRFWDEYIPGLGKLFACQGSHAVATSFCCAATQVLTPEPRHLAYASVAPWFWVEPTSLLPHDFLGSKAELEGFASYGWKDTTRSQQAWEQITAAGISDTTFSGYYVEMRSARTSWFLLHWGAHPLNGLGAISIRQADPNSIIHPGPNTNHPQVRDRIEAGDPISGYLWTRGQSPFPAPGELMNLTATYGIHVKHYTMDDEGIPTAEHLPASFEFLSTTVTLHIGRPVGLSIAASNSHPSDARRARTRAARELSATVARARVFGRPDVGEMPTLTSAPKALRDPLDSRAPPPDGPPGGTRGWMEGRQGALEGTGPTVPDGVARPAVPQYDAQRYPQIIRPQQAPPRWRRAPSSTYSTSRPPF